MTWSSRPVWARPVRTLARSFLNDSMLLCIFCSVAFFSSGIIALSPRSRCGPSYVNQRALVLAEDDALQRVGLEDAEDADRQLLVPAQRERGGVHHAQVLRDRLVEADPGVALRARIVLRIGRVDAVHLGRLDDDLRAHLAAAQRRRRVRGEEGVAGARGEDHDLPLLQVADRLAADVGLHHLLDVERRERAACKAGAAHRVLQRQGVHDRGQHSHVVGRGPVHPRRARRHAAEDVPAADHHPDLQTHPRHRGDLGDDALDRLPVDAERILAHQGFPRQLEEDPFVLRRQCAFPACAITSAAKSADFFSMPSPTTNSAKPPRLAFFDARSFSTVCLSSLTKAWPSSEISPRYLLTAPSTILAAISAGLPESLARAACMSRSRATTSAGTSFFDRYAGLNAATCIAMSLPSSSGPS